MTKNKNLLLLVSLLVFAFQYIDAQTNSPYSRYGYGVLKDQATGISKGMGGIGYGLRTNLGSNPLNPASYSAVDSLTMLIDVGVHYSRSKLSDMNASRTDNSGGFDYATLMFALNRKIGFSVGILPYSTVGYDYGSDDSASGVEYQRNYSGSGGLSLAYFGLGYDTPLKGFSVGANASYIFGSIENQRSIPKIDVSGSNTSSDYSKLKSKGVKLDLGFQYATHISMRDELVIGAVYSPKMNLRSEYQNRHYDLSSAGTLIKGDTLSVRGLNGAIPHTFGLGFTIKRDKRITYGADVTYEKWKNLKYSHYMGDGLSTADRFNNRLKVNAGVEYMDKLFDRNLFKRIKWRGGFNYSNSYMNIQNAQGGVDGYDEYGITIGAGIPFYDRQSYGKRTSYININLDYKKLKPKSSGMIDEQYFGVSVSVNMNDLWFMKRKI